MRKIFQGAMIAISFTTLITVQSSSSWACDSEGQTGLLPKNNMRIGVNQLAGVSDVTEAKFNAVMDRISEKYTAIVKAKGGTFQINRLWTNATVNASAQRSGTNWIINMYGGLARHPAITADGLMLAACHELGHHIGGAPVYTGDWASNEGQSDYWGGTKCARRVWSDDDNIQIVASMNIDAKAKEVCDLTWRDDKERALCTRIAMAGRSVANLFAEFDGLTINFGTPDPKVVTATAHSHPKSQCRLDTYFQSSLCTANLEDDVSYTDTVRGICTKSQKFEVGIRPTCWYKPAAAEL